MATAYDNDGQALQNVNVNIVTFSLTTSGSDRALLVYVALNGTAQTVSSITYSGVGLTFIGALNLTGILPGRIECWGLVGPATGANNVVVTLSANNSAWDASAISFTGALQTSVAACFTGLQTDLSGSDVFTTVTITTGSVGDLCSSGTISTSNNGTTPTSPAVQRWLDNAGTTNTQGSTQAGGASVTMQENWDTNSDANSFGMIGVNVTKAAAAVFPLLPRRRMSGLVRR